MTKGEFIDEVANRLPGCQEGRRGGGRRRARDVNDTALKGGGDVAFCRLRQVPRHEALGTHRREPAEPGSEGPVPAATVPKFSAGSTSGRGQGLAVCWRWRPPGVGAVASFFFFLLFACQDGRHLLALIPALRCSSWSWVRLTGSRR